VPIIVADASGAFCHLGHRGANKRSGGTVLRRGSSAVDNTMNSRHFIRSPRPRSACEHRCRDGQRMGSSVRAAAIPVQLLYGDTGGTLPSRISVSPAIYLLSTILDYSGVHGDST
jgi:hypothetical protein